MNDRTERLWSRGLHALGFVAAALAASSLFAGVYFPLTGREAALEQQVDAAWRLLGNTETISRQHADAKDALAAAEEHIRRVREQIPETAQESMFLDQLSRLASETGFEIHDYRPGTAEPHDFCQQIRVQVGGRGEFEAVCRFLAGLDRLPRVCRVVGCGIEASSASDELDVDLTLVMFFGVRQEALDAAKGNSP